MLLGLLIVIVNVVLGKKIDITPTLSCSEYHCLVPRKSCIIILISRNPSK